MSMNWRTEKWKRNEAFSDIISFDLDKCTVNEEGAFPFPVCSQVIGEDRANLIAAAPDMLRALDECDTFLAVANVTCDDLTPQVRGLLGKTWASVQQAMLAALPNTSLASLLRNEPGVAMQVFERRRKAVERLLSAAKDLAEDMSDTGEDADENGNLYSGNAELVEAIKEVEDSGIEREEQSWQAVDEAAKRVLSAAAQLLNDIDGTEPGDERAGQWDRYAAAHEFLESIKHMRGMII